jgi:hypothetical protein
MIPASHSLTVGRTARPVNIYSPGVSLAAARRKGRIQVSP